MEHPDLSYVLQNGYPRKMFSGIENVIAQKECCGIDFYGCEILSGDEIAIDHDHFDELILKENLKRYCTEQLNFKFAHGWVFENDDFFRERWIEQVLHEEYNFEFRTAD